MIDRIRLVMEYSKLTQQEFAARIDTSASSLSGIFTGRTQPSAKHVNGIHRAYPEINVNWLMFGEGNMITGNDDDEALNAAASDNGLGLDFSEPDAGNNATVGATNGASLQPNSASPEGAFATTPSANYPLSGSNNKVRDMRGVARGNSNISPAGMMLENDGRKIKEIRVFYSNGTYESFVPSNK